MHKHCIRHKYTVSKAAIVHSIDKKERSFIEQCWAARSQRTPIQFTYTHLHTQTLLRHYFSPWWNTKCWAMALRSLWLLSNSSVFGWRCVACLSYGKIKHSPTGHCQWVTLTEEAGGMDPFRNEKWCNTPRPKLQGAPLTALVFLLVLKEHRSLF